MVEAIFFGLVFLVCAVVGLSVVLAGLTMAMVDVRTYGALGQAYMDNSKSGKRIAGDVLLTSIGLMMVAGGTSGILAIVGVL